MGSSDDLKADDSSSSSSDDLKADDSSSSSSSDDLKADDSSSSSSSSSDDDQMLAVMNGEVSGSETMNKNWMMEAALLVLTGAAMAMLFASLLSKYRASKVDSEYTPLVSRNEMAANRV